MSSFLPETSQAMILMVLIGVLFLLAIYLPWRRNASVTGVISVSIIIVFIAQILLSSDMVYDVPLLSSIDKAPAYDIYLDIGFHPKSIVEDHAVYQFITSTYLHANFMHLIFNFIGLFLIGVQLEKKIGWYRFLILYFGSGIIAGALVLMISPFNVVGHSMDIPSIGASGCIFGIIGGYWFMYPKDKLFFPLPLYFIRMTNRWPVSMIFLIYGGITAFYLLVGSEDNTSHIAHFGGLVGAFPVAALIKPPDKVRKVKKMKEKDLEHLAKSAEQKEYLKKAMKADEKEIRNAWLDEFFHHTRCPNCRSSNMMLEEEKGICPKCGKIIKP